MKRVTLLYLFVLFFIISTSRLVLADANISRYPQAKLVNDGYEKAYQPSTTFDSRSYSLKRLREDFTELSLVFNPIGRYHYKIKLANVRLLEIQDLCQRGKCGEISPLINAYNKNWTETMEFLDKFIEKENDMESLFTSMFISLRQNELMINRLILISDGQDKGEINTLEKTFKKHKERAELFWGNFN